MNKICHFTSVHHRFDTRIFRKQCISLTSVFEVVLIAPEGDGQFHDGVFFPKIPRIPSNRIVRILFVLPYLIIKTLQQKAALYHFHDPELIIVGWVLKVFGKKVIYDVHEDYPRDILEKKWIWSPFRVFLSNLIRQMEQISFKLFDATVVVTEDISRYFGGEKCYIIHNYPILSLIDSVVPQHKEKKTSTVLYYVGDISEIRGIPKLINALTLIEPEVVLWLAGSWENAAVKKTCENSPGWKRCIYFGRLPFHEAIGLMKSADLGVIPFQPHGNHFNALPNKAFEYLSCQLPMVMSEFDYWKTYFRDLAFFFDPTNESSIAEVIVKVLLAYQEAIIRAAKGRAFVEENRSWESEQHVLVSMYDKILGNERSGS